MCLFRVGEALEALGSVQVELLLLDPHLRPLLLSRDHHLHHSVRQDDVANVAIGCEYYGSGVANEPQEGRK